MTSTIPKSHAALSHRLADAARQAILPYFRSDMLATDNKASAGFDPVTVADRAAERAMRDILEREVPEDGILGEEFGPKPSESGLTWILDPIDGTRGFVAGTPTWGVLVALSDESGPKIGIIDQPYIGERFVGAPEGAHFERDGKSRVIQTSATTDLADAVIFTTFPEVGTEQEGLAFHAVASRTRLTRYGMDCYAYALLAAGQIDLVIEAGLYAYDICAPIAVIEAAGGVVTDWDGNPVHEGGRALAAATPELHEQALQILRQQMG